MTLTPRVVVVHRRTEREELVRQQGTWGQAKFVQKRRGCPSRRSRPGTR